MAEHLREPNYRKAEDRDCARCMYKKPGRRQCRNRTCDRFPYCYVHLRQEFGLVLAESTIQDAGRGLFFVGYLKPNGRWKKILYPPDRHGNGGDIVTYYSSPDVETKAAFDARYDAHPGFVDAVYAYETPNNMVMDSRNTMNFPGRFLNDVAGAANVEFGTEYEWNAEFNRFMLPLFPTVRIDARKKPVELFVDYGEAYWKATEDDEEEEDDEED